MACNCKNVEIQSYDNQVTMELPTNIVIHKNDPDKTIRKFVSVDKCLANELMYLWKIGIRTTGCCCGHKKALPYIGVYEDDIQKMIDLGYVVQTNCCGIDDMNRQDSFYPKSIDITPEMVEFNFRHFTKILLQEFSKL